MAVEYCAGGDLKRLIHAVDVPLSWFDRLLLALEVSRGVAYLHSMVRL